MEPTNTGTGDQNTTGQPTNNGTPGTDASFNPPWLNFQPAGGQPQGDGTTPPPVVTPVTEQVAEPTITAENVTPAATIETNPAPIVETSTPTIEETHHEEEFDPFINPFDSGEDEASTAEPASMPQMPSENTTTTGSTSGSVTGTSLQILESFYATMKEEEKNFHTELNDIHQEMAEEKERHTEALKELEEEKHRVKNEHREKLAKYKEVLSKLNEMIMGPGTKETKKPALKAIKAEEPTDDGAEASESFLGA